jgi:hypothetical protein
MHPVCWPGKLSLANGTVIPFAFVPPPGYYNPPQDPGQIGAWGINDFGQFDGSADAPQVIPEPNTFLVCGVLALIFMRRVQWG